MDRRRFLKGAGAAVGGLVVMGQSADGCEEEEPPPDTTTTTTEPPPTTEPPTTTTTTEPPPPTTEPPTTTTTEPTDPGVDRVVTGDQPGGFTVPAGETWEILGLVTTPANVIVRGTLRMRSGATLRFRNVNEAAFVGGNASAPVASDVGLWVIDHGQLDARGTPKVPWTRAVGSLSAGVTTVQVSDASGWQPGDVLAVTPTVPWFSSGSRVGNFYDRYSVRRVTAIDGNRITLDGGLQNPHPSRSIDGWLYTAEVLNLTRDVRIEGTSGGRAHVMWTHAHELVDLSHVEVSQMGVPGKLGRYPLHWHMMGDDARGSLIEGVVVHDSGNHGFVPHTSHGMTLRSCVSHDTRHDPFWWDEDSFTNASVWEHCVASRITGEGRVAGFNLGAHDRFAGPSASVINVIRDCVAVGRLDDDYDLSGFNSNDSAGYIWPELDLPDATPEDQMGTPWIFERNLAHNCGNNALFVWQNEANEHFVDDTVAYSCSVGINHGAYGNRYIYRRFQMRDVHRALWLHAGNNGRGDEAMAFEDIDAEVLAGQAVQLNSATAGFPVEPMQFRRCRFVGYTQHGLRASGDGGGPADDEFPQTADLHDTTWEPGLPHVVLTSGAPSGTRVREFEGGELVATHQK